MSDHARPPLLAEDTVPASMIPMSWKGVAIALVKAQGLHEGIWRVYFRFGGVSGLNANVEGRVSPSALVPVLEMGLMRDTVLTDLSVDASVVNPHLLH